MSEKQDEKAPKSNDSGNSVEIIENSKDDVSSKNNFTIRQTGLKVWCMDTYEITSIGIYFRIFVNWNI